MLQEYTKKRVGADVCIWFTFGSHNWKQAGSIACSKWGGQCAVYDAEWLESLPQKQWGVVFSLWSRGGTCWILCSVQTVLTVVQVPPVWGMSRLPRGRRGKLSSHCWVQRKLHVEMPFPLAVTLCLGVLVRLRTYQLLQHSSLLSSLLLFSPALTFFFSPHKTRTACALHVTVIFEGNGLVYGNSVGEEFWNCHRFWLWSSCLGSTLNKLFASWSFLILQCFCWVNS